MVRTATCNLATIVAIYVLTVQTYGPYGYTKFLPLTYAATFN